MTLRRFLPLGSLLLAVFLVAACGSDDENDRDPSGLWVGEMKSDNSDTYIPALLMVTEDGSAFIWRDDGVIQMRFRMNERRFTIQHEALSSVGETWDGNTGYLIGTLDGLLYEPADADFPDVTPGSGISVATNNRLIVGDYTLGSETGSFLFFHDAVVSAQSVTAADIAGTWSGSDHPLEAIQNATVIGRDGAFSGVTATGCSFQGQLELPESGNGMKVTRVSSQCPRYADFGLNGQLNGGKGVAFMLDTANQQMAFVWVFDWEQVGLSGVLIRQ